MCCSQSGHHPENNLAKFGYILDMKKEKKNRILLYSWLLGTYWGILSYLNLANLVGSFFLAMKNPLFRSKSYFSSFKFALKGIIILNV